MNRIIVGIDDPDDAQDLVEWTAQFAGEVHCRVTVLHAVHRSEVWLVAGAQLDGNTYLRAARHRTELDVVAPLRERGVRVDLRVEIGDPAQSLASLARRTRADMIVIGATPHGAFRELFAGNVEHRLERLTGIPLVVVPTSHAAHATH